MRTRGPLPREEASGAQPDGTERDEVDDVAHFARRLGGGAAVDSFGLYPDLADAIAEDGGADPPGAPPLGALDRAALTS